MSILTPDETILGLLAGQSRHGYDILERFRDSQHLGEIWQLSTSQIYAVLKRLERDGLITGETVTTGQAPPRTEYRLTESGERDLWAWLNEARPSASIRRIRVEFMSRLYIAQLLSIPTDALIQQQRGACEAARERLVAELQGVEGWIHRTALELHLAQIDAVLGWIDHITMPSIHESP